MKPALPRDNLSALQQEAAPAAGQRAETGARRAVTHSGDVVPERYRGTANRPSTIELTLPPPLRKQPRQARSTALVIALKEAALHILETEGRPALTLQRLSEHAGVAASSIYEYFPGMDALVSALFEDALDRAAGQLLADMQTLPAQATLLQAIEVLVSHSLAINHKLHAVDPVVHRDHVRYFELLRLLPKDSVYTPPMTGSTQLLFERYAHDIRVKDRDKAFYLFCRTVHTMVRAITLDRPEYLGDPDTLQMLAHMLHDLLTGKDDSG